MPWVEFTAKFDWTDPRLVVRTEAFQPNMVRNVTTPCAEKAIAEGKAIRTSKRCKSP